MSFVVLVTNLHKPSQAQGGDGHGASYAACMHLELERQPRQTNPPALYTCFMQALQRLLTARNGPFPHVQRAIEVNQCCPYPAAAAAATAAGDAPRRYGDCCPGSCWGDTESPERTVRALHS